MGDIKGITARLHKLGVEAHKGTAWLCSEEYAITAAHCVGNRKTRVPSGDVYTLKFRWGSLQAEVKRCDFDMDAALLLITGGDKIPDRVMVTLGELPSEDPWPVGDTRFRWQCWGYPSGKPSGMRVSGDIEDPKGDIPEDPEAYGGKLHVGIQLACDTGGLDNLDGLSGAPVRYDKNIIVGLVRWGPDAFKHKVIYAAPLSEIVKAFPELKKIVTDNVKSDIKQGAPNLLTSADTPPPGPDAEKAPADADPHAPGSAKLFGRDDDIDAVSRLLREERARLLTLAGPRGAGKTVLAQAVCRGLRGDYQNGVHFVDLSLVSDPEKVAAEIAHVLGVKEAKAGSLEESLIVYLGDRPTLLILDGFEELHAARALVERLLDKSAGLQIILTCRAALGWPRERVFEVGPLAAGADGGGQPEASPSVALFVDRARRAGAGYEFDAPTLRVIADVCERLGDLPLAVALAAAQSAVPEYGPARLLEELSGPGVEDPCDQLARVVEMSYRSLDENAQECLRRLTVFAGPPTPEAAEGVASADAEAGEVREALSLLLGRGLLREEKLPGRGVRYRMPRPVLEYCAARLKKAGEEASARRSHAAFYSLLTKKAERRLNLLSSAERREWLEALEAEHDEISAAVDWSLGGECGNVETALEIVGNMFWFWNLRAYLTEGRRRADAVLAGARAALKTETESFGKALYCAGGLAFMHGDYAAARALLAESVDVWTGLPNHRRLGYSLIVLGMVALNQNQLEEARAHEERCVALFKEVDDRWGLALALNDLGNVCLEADDVEGARSNFHKSLAVWGELGDHWGYGLTNSNLAYLAYRAGDLLMAKQLLTKASGLQRDEGNQWGWAESTKRLGHITLDEGDHALAASLFYDSMALHQKIGRKQLVADCLDGLAQVAAGLGQPARAARLFGAATSVRASIGARMSRPQTALREASVAAATSAAAKKGMTREEFQKAWAEGELWTLEVAVAEATVYAKEWSA
ncbi:MAG TPA: tetratricopeptide repeat protein [Pyrinomonadaceae bacterium]